MEALTAMVAPVEVSNVGDVLWTLINCSVHRTWLRECQAVEFGGSAHIDQQPRYLRSLWYEIMLGFKWNKSEKGNKNLAWENHDFDGEFHTFSEGPSQPLRRYVVAAVEVNKKCNNNVVDPANWATLISSAAGGSVYFDDQCTFHVPQWKYHYAHENVLRREIEVIHFQWVLTSLYRSSPT